MQVEIVMPKMGESIQEGTILHWAKKVGEKIEKDETILEISTDKVDSEIPSPVNGILMAIVVKEQETVPVGTVIAYIETDPSKATPGLQKTFSESFKMEPPVTNSASRSGVDPEKYDQTQNEKIHRLYSPLVKTIAKKEKLDNFELSQIAGTGSNGRVTKRDILFYLDQREIRDIVVSSKEQISVKTHTDWESLTKKYQAPRYNVVRMDTIQRKMAEHMVRSVSTSPHVTVVDEVDMTSIVNFRLSILEKFEKQNGFKLTFTPFFAYAAIQVLKEFPIANSTVEGDAIIYKNFINLGIAVASPKGLIVPVVRNAEEKNFLDMARSLIDLSVRARTKKLMPDEIVDGTFSITNYGVFGNILGTPIINQPQVAILGIGAIKKRPVVLTSDAGDDSMGIRSMAYLTLSFDHRVIDGAIGGQCVSRVKWYLEHFNFDMVNV
jgi:2-oxoglutarate dehydrogenase complex dihydrolipoamide succinyltransferase (E2) component